jgi:hypothetical protein
MSVTDQSEEARIRPHVYTPMEDVTILTLRHTKSPTEIGRRIGLTRGQVRARLATLLAMGQKKVSRRQERIRQPLDWQKPCFRPFGADTSVPRFADHDGHVAAVMAQGGFKVLRIDYARRK